jgi:hypothetical protein
MIENFLHLFFQCDYIFSQHKNAFGSPKTPKPNAVLIASLKPSQGRAQS